MPGPALPRRTTTRGVVLLGTVLATVAATAVPAAADRPGRDDVDVEVDVEVIELPGAGGAEGIAPGRGATFYAGDLSDGDVYRGDLRRGTAELFIDAPEGRVAVGMDTDLRHGLLFVAGGPTGQAYVYDTRSGETVAEYQLGGTTGSFVNDVAVTRDGAWFTDSRAAQLHHVPLDRHGGPGEAETLPLHGPAAALTGEFNLNGIADARHGRVLIVAHSTNEALYTVDPATGDSAAIDVGTALPDADGVEYRDGQVWVVQNQVEQIARIDLSRDLASGEVVEVVTDDDFQVPTTAILYRGGLAAVNAQFGLGPAGGPFEVVLVD
ncbi:SMP-30/Gluconolaconase/LRE-like region-containing protein [Geodermatophilus pulveris]|uniref:SMP-30/Gluconolaconase/LRE-like region-containing protein n=1 Tax=Geodermatophilus pulveris TaxID=1564159 RepID=A0A239FXN6_9ACTN|nr:SMP-30/gluconolactonase/LRE family protein [Geodermatophilus pulveris]SNS61649.1 SMP-30/Gluconolaconase/LRE-like region-containing protein [Geodermatophilus pulveris]